LTAWERWLFVTGNWKSFWLITRTLGRSNDASSPRAIKIHR
jgi:hypothetical protein